MKICPKCQQTYPDAQRFCPNDGTTLNQADAAGGGFGGAAGQAAGSAANQPFGSQPQGGWNPPPQQQYSPQPQAAAARKGGSKIWIIVVAILGVLLLLCGGGLVGVYFYLTTKIDETVNTINISSNPTPANTTTNTSSSPSSKTNSKLTMDKYNQVKNGMSYKEAVNVLGVEGTETSNSEIGNYKTVSYKWDGENYSFIVATFQNDKMIFKTQYGLK